MKHCSIRAHAKLDVTLEVLRRRDDGYHDVVHVKQALELHDVVSVSITSDGRIAFASTSKEIDPTDNLCVRAARALGVQGGVRIELDKRIPIAAGLGGGSSDAAAVLVALRRLLGLSIADAALLEIAGSIGSDVPFFLGGPLALCEGRGERVTPLAGRAAPSLRWLLLVKPAKGVLTREAYEGLRDFTDGSHSYALAQRDVIEARDLMNGIEGSIFARYPHVAEARDALLAAGATRALLCGTGSTVCAPFERLEDAVRVRARFASYETHLTQPLEAPT